MRLQKEVNWFSNEKGLKRMADFVKGLFAGLVLAGMIVFFYFVISSVTDNSGYKDKLVIEYHCPDKEYNRELVYDMMMSSGIQTNFLNKECSMDKYRIQYKLTNPQ